MVNHFLIAFHIGNLREHTEKESSLLFTDPKTAKEWNYEKNGRLKPENFTANSNKKVWWKCKKRTRMASDNQS